MSQNDPGSFQTRKARCSQGTNGVTSKRFRSQPQEVAADDSWERLHLVRTVTQWIKTHQCYPTPPYPKPSLITCRCKGTTSFWKQTKRERIKCCILPFLSEMYQGVNQILVQRRPLNSRHAANKWRRSDRIRLLLFWNPSWSSRSRSAFLKVWPWTQGIMRY